MNNPGTCQTWRKNQKRYIFSLQLSTLKSNMSESKNMEKNKKGKFDVVADISSYYSCQLCN